MTFLLAGIRLFDIPVENLLKTLKTVHLGRILIRYSIMYQLVPSSVTMHRKPSYACFFVRFAKRACSGGSFWYKLGIWLFGLNWFVGYGGIAICTALASATSRRGWLVAGGVCYAVSWGMLGLGTLLMGVEAKRRLVGEYKTQIKAFKRLRKMTAHAAASS